MAAKMTDPRLLLQAGIDAKSGLPIRCNEKIKDLDFSIKKQLRIVDEQDAVNKVTWHNLPYGLDQNIIERVLYYKGQGMLFLYKDKFYFLPFALDGEIDAYGRYLSVTPLVFSGSDKDIPFLGGKSFNVFYDVQDPKDYLEFTDEELEDILTNSTVILRDYTSQLSQTVIPRQLLNEPLLAVMSECIPYMRTSLINSTGVQGMKVPNENQTQSVYDANAAIQRASLTGSSVIPIVGEIDFQDMGRTNAAKASEYLMAMQSLDNYRLSLLGLKTGGIFQKKSHMLEAEQEMNSGNVGLIQRDYLRNRQEFCNIVNSIWGLDMWCEASETVLDMDTTGDGTAGNDETVNLSEEDIVTDDEL